jgi:DNA-binding NtrC family response regulator
MNLLLIDDDRMTLKALRQMLTLRGHTVVLASNKLNALKQLKENKVDCIVSDVNMPDTSLPELFTALLDCNGKHVPTILISSEINNPVMDDTLIAGADAFIPKPVNPELLDQVIRRVTRGLEEVSRN